MKVYYVNHGLANNFGRHVEINKLFLTNTPLHDKLLEHELKHVGQNPIRDFFHDFKDGFSKLGLSAFIFSLKHPSTWSQLNPYYKDRNGERYWDISLLFFYLISFLFIIVLGGIL